MFIEKAQQEANVYSLALMNNYPDIAYYCRSENDWTMEFISDGCFSVTGYHPSDIMNNRKVSYAKLVYPQDRDLAISEIRMAIAERRFYKITYRVTDAKGEERWIWEQGRGIFLENGKLFAIEGVIIDITEHKHGKKKLEDRERFLSDIFMSIQDGLSILDMELNIVRVNPVMEKRYSYSLPLIGKKCYEAYYGRKKPCEGCPSLRTIQTGESFNEVVPYLWPGGETAGWLELRSFPLIDTATGNIKGVIEYARDITERKRAEVEISEWKHRYELIVVSSDQLVYEYDTSCGSILWGGSLQQVLGYTLSEMSGGINQRIEMIHPEDRSKVLGFLDAFQKNFVPFDAEYRLRKKNGSYVWVHDRGFLIFDSTGKAARILGVIQNISERKNTEEELRLSVEKLKRDMEGTIQALAITSEIRDPYTSGHERRVAQLACVIAKEMDFSDFQVEGVRVAGILHDIGKISVPAEILSRPGKISEPELSLIKLHPQVGYEILKNVDFSWPVPLIILQHHERVDGTGYPLGLCGDNIRLEAKIIGVADVVEAMASHRPYRPALGIAKALEEISEYRGTLYDDKVVDVCIKIITDKGFKFE